MHIWVGLLIALSDLTGRFFKKSMFVSTMKQKMRLHSYFLFQI